MTGGAYLSGGAGNDQLVGNAYSNDTYIFNLGDGQDVISRSYYSGGNDTLIIGPNITVNDINISRSGFDLVLSHSNGQDQITIQNWYRNTLQTGQYQLDEIRFEDGTIWDRQTVTDRGYWTREKYQLIERIEFADGTVWDAAKQDSLSLVVEGTEADDTLRGIAHFANTLNGGAGNDTLTSDGGDGDILNGGDGDDLLNADRQPDTALNLHLNGGAGNDTLDARGSLNTVLNGGTGNDSLIGGARSDIYLFNLGDGKDTITEHGDSFRRNDEIRFGSGINVSDISVTRVGQNLVLNHIIGQDQITINNWFDGTQNKIEQIKFNDGTIWEREAVTSQFTSVSGTDGDDTLLGGSGIDDIIDGGKGNDTIDGCGGTDILIGDEGDDILTNYSGDNSQLFGGTGNDTLSGEGNNLILDGGADTWHDCCGRN